MKGGTRPSTVAIPTSHGSSIRRRASLYTQNAVASQKTPTKNSVRFRITAQVPDEKKSKIPLSASSTAPPSEEDLPDDIAGGKREADDRQDDDRGDREDAQPLAELSHGIRSRRTLRSASR